MNLFFMSKLGSLGYLRIYDTYIIPSLSKPQPNLNTRLGLTIKPLCTTTHPTETQYQEYLSCYCPDFDETLQVGSWEHLEQIPTVPVTFVQAIFVKVTFVLVTFVHIRNISAVTDTIWTKL